MIIKYGKLQIEDSELIGLTFEEVANKFGHYNKILLRGAWELANPKGTVKKSKKTEEENGQLL